MTGIPDRLVRLREGLSEGAADTMYDLRRIVRSRLRDGVYRLSLKRRTHRRGTRPSTVWEHFRMVEDERGAGVGYAGCRYCLDVLRHDPHLSGTSSLFNHLRSCSGYAAAKASATLPGEPETKTGLADVTVKEEAVDDEEWLLAEDQQQYEPDSSLLEAYVDCLASDLLPPHTLHSASFLHLAQLLLECGAKSSTTQTQALLPSQVQVAARVATRAAEARQHLLGKLMRGSGRFCAALVLSEMPGQQHGHRALLLRTMHEWRLQTHFLGLCLSAAEAERQDPREEVAKTLKKFHHSDAWDKLPLVCGGVAPMDDEGVVPCASRMLGRAVKYLLEAPQEPLSQVREYLDKCRGLARWAATEDVGLASSLVTDEGDTWAWRRTLAMVEGVCAAGAELRQAGPRCSAAAALGDASLALLSQLAMLLQPVRAAATELETPHIATLHKVVPWLLHLSNTCQPVTADVTATATMKAALREGLEKHAAPTCLHRLAVFFNPRMSSLRVLAPEEQRQVRQAVLSIAGQAAAAQPEGDKPRKPDGPLTYLEDARPAALSVGREVEVYDIMQDDADSDDLLAWWRRTAALLPLLAAAAARVLATPASTALPTTAATALEDLSDKLLRPPHDDPGYLDDLALLHARLAGL